MNTELLKKHKDKILFIGILLAGVLVRTFLFPGHPGGLNQDEASIGYDAWALANFGIDRNGYSIPVHFLAWGSGQNALYAYLSIPFIKLFGLNVFSIRIVNLIFGCLTIGAVFGFVKRFWGKRPAYIAMAMTAIAPWHIMLSRWGLESNLFPGMFMLALWVLAISFDRPKLLILSAVLFALSLYAYGSAYVVVTLFCLIVFIYILAKKAVGLNICLFSAAAFVAVAAPIYLFVLVNLFHLGDIHLWIFTIPQTYGDRMVSMFNGLTVQKVSENLFNLIILQTDGSKRNAFPVYGCLYVISLPFMIAGVIRCIRKKGRGDFILNAAAASAFVLFVVYSGPNINRVNAVYLPMIIYSALGVHAMVKGRRSLCAVAAVYSVMFSGFCVQYFGDGYKHEISSEFFASFGEAIEKAESIAGADETIYVTNRVNMPYIYILFYTQPAPERYLETVEIQNRETQFQQVNAFGRYVFNLSGMDAGQPGIYILDNTRDIYQDIFDEFYQYDRYSVGVVTNETAE